MQVTVESTGTLERRMRVELPAERIDKEVESRLKSVGKTAKIKGFRPGKVPAKVIRQRYGMQVRQEVLSDLMGQSYRDAVAQENLNPVAQPTIEPELTESTGTFAYVATFEVLPEIRLENLDQIEVTRPDIEITDEDRDDMLTNLRQQKATWKGVERKAKEGDRVTIDFEGTHKGEPIENGKGENVPVILGHGQMLPDFEKGLIGVAAGDEKTLKVKFPKDYHAEDMASKKIDFSVRVISVEEQELPPLDDSLAAAYGIEEGGLEKLREDVVDNMQRELDQRIKADLREQAMEGLLEANPLEIPKALQQQEMHSMQHEAMRQLGIEDHEHAPPLENFSESAEKRVRLALLVRQLVDENGIAADGERLKAHVEEMCAGYEDADEMVATYLANPQIMAQIEPRVIEEQAIEWLVENGVEKTKKATFKDYMNP